ncbi:hypothetical protein FALCPG4_008789 [Fusarium falciforme]
MASKKAAPTYTQILPIHYSNGNVLKAYLDQKCGGKPYTMSLRNNNWTITVSKKLSQDEIDEVTEKMRRHYHNRQ